MSGSLHVGLDSMFGIHHLLRYFWDKLLFVHRLAVLLN